MEMIIFSLVVLIMKATCETAEQYKELILEKHNGYRREQGGSNINKLVTNVNSDAMGSFVTIKPSRNVKINLSFTDVHVGKSGPCREFITS